MFKFIATIIATLVMSFSFAAPAEAYRPHPGMKQKDVCKNIKGTQTIGDIIYGKYRFNMATRRPNDCKRVRR